MMNGEQRSRAADALARWIVVAAWCAIVLGAAFRVVQLPSRALFLDEAITQIRVAGHTGADVLHTLYDGKPRPVRTLRASIAVNSKSSAGRTVASLAAEDAQHPPLFYVAELAAVRTFGDSLFAWRFLPVQFGLLAIAAAYALARTLFDARAGLIAAALFAVSPVERIYSQQAREYSLLTLLVLVATLAIVVAVRKKSIGLWAAYAVVTAAALYTSPFMVYVLAAHAVFAAACALRKNGDVLVLVRFAFASAVALAAYIPWLVQLAIHRRDIVDTNVWSGTPWPLSLLVTKWLFNTGATFFDLEYANVRWAAVLVPVVLIAIVAAARGIGKADERARWCLGAGIVVPALLLVVPDLLLGEHRSSVARYALPMLAIVPILVARGLAGRPLSTLVLFAAGICAGVVGLAHASWWDNDTNGDDARIAAAINAIPGAQIVSTLSPLEFVSFARHLNSDTRVSLNPTLAGTHYTAGRPLVVLRPAAADLAALRARTGLAFEPVPFVRSIRAHDIGANVAHADGRRAGLQDLYVASSLPRLSANLHAAVR